jgi:uncharacterized protein
MFAAIVPPYMAGQLFLYNLKFKIMMKFEVYKGNNDDLSFRLVDDKGKTLLSGDGYRQKEVILNNIETVKKNLPLNGSIEMKSTPQGKYFFNVKGGYGQLVGSSIEFESPELRDKWLRDIQKEVGQSKVVEVV